MRKFKGLCGETWFQTVYRDGHISAECTHKDSSYMTTDSVGAKEEALKICEKCPYKISDY